MVKAAIELRRLAGIFLVGSLVTGGLQAAFPTGPIWPRHVIDDTKNGADGVRLDDVNGDGLLDDTTAWEQGNVVRAYINPGPLGVRGAWPQATVGAATSGEDAVFVDLDGDGVKDVVASTEGSSRKVLVFWAPTNPANYFNQDAWTRDTLYSGDILWMYAVPVQLDGANGPDLIIGGKNSGAEVGWLRSPAGNKRDVGAWQYSKITDATWVMTLSTQDIDRDGDLDILLADRAELVWLENPGPGPAQSQPWTRRSLGLPVSPESEAVSFTGSGDLDRDGDIDYIAAADRLYFVENVWDGVGKPDASDFRIHVIPTPEGIGGGLKSARIGDIDLDGKPDIVLTSGSNPDATQDGLVWLSYASDPRDPNGWTVHRLSGPDGVKYDDCPLADLDGDGDLDVIITEELKPNGPVTGLGVIWYENPTLSPESASVVNDWNLAAIQITKVQPPFAGTVQNSNLATRIHAIEAAAVYNAVNSVLHFGTPYGGYTGSATSPASAEAAAAQAAHDVLANYFPTQKSKLDTLLATSLGRVSDETAKANGVAAGASAASHIIALRASDGSSPNATYSGPASPGVGVYQLTPNVPTVTAPPFSFPAGINSQWGVVAPFVLASGSQFRPAPPPAVGSTAYNTALAQVKAYGTPASARHTAEQTHIAQFYKQDPEIVVNEAARQLSASNHLTLPQRALLFAQVDLALADSRIAAWDAGYFYKFWRPITALNAAATGAVTNSYSAWQPVVVTPNSPSYPSDHGATLTAGVQILRAFFGDAQALTLHALTLGPAEAPRTVASLPQIEADGGLSRIYGGAHFSFDNDAGQQLGANIAAYVLANGPRRIP